MIRAGRIILSSYPVLMGILNVTPDSFSDGGRFASIDAAVEQGFRLIKEGAQILDVGGESTRPGAEPVSEAEERERVLRVIATLAGQTDVPISVDTYKSRIAAEALAAGARIVNDISGLTFDPQMVAVCKEYRAGVVCMHIQGTPQTMQRHPIYQDVLGEITEFFRQRMSQLEAEGIDPESLVLDPGVGFGKTAAHNVAILGNVQKFQQLGYPVLIGHSRKRFLKHVLSRDVEERLAGTLGTSVALAQQGVDIIRVHDVAANRDAIAAWRTISDAALPAEPQAGPQSQRQS